MLKDCVLIEPFKCNVDDKIIDVAKKLKSSKIRQIFVVDKKGYPTGIISTTDMNNRVIADGKDPNGILAKDIMSKPIEVYNVDDNEYGVYQKMLKKRRLLCAVCENKKFIGMLTMDSVLHTITNPKGD